MLVVAASAPARAQAPVDTAARDTVKLTLIHQLLTQMHSVDQAITIMETGIPAQRAANPRIPAVFWDRLLAQVRARRGELEEMMADVYARHFTSDDVRQLLAFYRTPVGQKLLAMQPAVLQESMAAGQAWGARLAQGIGEQLEAEGVHMEP